MKTAVIALFSFALLALGAVSGTAFGADAKTQKFVGYLSDVMCGEAGKDMDGLDLKAHPEKHTVACITACTTNDYGMILTGQKTYTFYKFDSAGDGLARSILAKTRKKAGVLVEVTGSLKDGVVSVRTMKEK